MKLKLCPTGGAPESTSIEMTSDNRLVINGEEYIFDTGIAQFDPCPPILAAHRDEAGELWVTVHVLYSDAHRAVWETKDANGKYRGEDWETWAPGGKLYQEGV